MMSNDINIIVHQRYIPFLDNTITSIKLNKYYAAHKNFKNFMEIFQIKTNINYDNYDVLSIDELLGACTHIFGMMKRNKNKLIIKEHNIIIIYYSIKHYLNNQIFDIIKIINGLSYLLDKKNINIFDDDTSNLNYHKKIITYNTNLDHYANMGYLYGFISLLATKEIIVISYECSKKCTGDDLIINRKSCDHIVFHYMDGSVTSTGSGTIIFRGQLFLDLKYTFNYELLSRMVYKVLGNSGNMDGKNALSLLQKIINVLNIFIMSFKPLLFTKFYSVPSVKQNKFYKNDFAFLQYVKNILCSNVDVNTKNKLYSQSIHLLSKYNSNNEININKYLTNALHNNNLPHILSLIFDTECPPTNTKLNKILLKCGTIEECFKENTDIFTTDAYKMLMMEHAGKNSVQLKEFIMNSWRDEITDHDIAAIIIQIAYTLYSMNYVLGISHNDLHTENIFVETFWRIQSSYYLIMFGEVLNKIYHEMNDKSYDKFVGCRESAKEKQWEVINGLKGILYIQTKYEAKIFDFDGGHFLYGSFNEHTQNMSSDMYHNFDTPHKLIFEHPLKNIQEYSQTTNKFYLYKDLENSEQYSQQLFNINKKFGINNINKSSDKITNNLTRGDIMVMSNLIGSYPSLYHKYDMTTVALRIALVIAKEINDNIEKEFKINNNEEEKILSIQKLDKIKKKWFKFLRYLLGVTGNDELDYSIFFTTGAKFDDLYVKYGNLTRFKRSEINKRCTTSKSPIEVLFDVFKNHTTIGYYAAAKERPTHKSIDDTKIYAYHATQLSNITNMPPTSTMFTPPDITTNDKLDNVIRSICGDNNDMELEHIVKLNKIAPQLLTEIQKKYITENVFQDSINRLNDGLIVQY